jgi:ABC-type multidrug transport system fused ATPase/permease subunit
MSTRQARRPSTASLSSVAGGNYRTLMMVSKADFTEHYPALLLEITVDTGVLDEEEGKAEKPGVDITFQNLCLNIKVGDTSISVVNNVTGRVQGKTMTALMGGSGAGKSWWNCHLK